MPIVQVDVGGETLEFDTEASKDELQQYLGTDEGQADMRSQLEARAGAEEVDFQGEVAANQAAIDEDLNPLQRTAIGVGKSFNDIIQGAGQVIAEYVEGDEEKAKAIGEEVARGNKIFNAFDEKQVGLEDLGQIIGDAAAMSLGGGAALTIKGGAILGGLIEGIKATEGNSGLDRAGNAVGGLAGGLVGGAVAKTLTTGLSTAGMKEFLGSGVRTGMLGKVPRLLGLASKSISTKAAATNQAKKAILAQNKAKLTFKEKELLAQRAEQLDAHSGAAYKQLVSMANRMDSVGIKGVINDTTGTTLKTLILTSTKKLPNGEVGIDTADLIKEMPFLSRGDMASQLGPRFAAELDGFRSLWQKQAGEVLSVSQINKTMQKYAETITEETLPLLGAGANQKVKNTLLDYIISSSIKATTQDALEDGVPKLVEQGTGALKEGAGLSGVLGGLN